jgi:hypothetical protein
MSNTKERFVERLIYSYLWVINGLDNWLSMKGKWEYSPKHTTLGLARSLGVVQIVLAALITVGVFILILGVLL